jgi:hypothetical protein
MNLIFCKKKYIIIYVRQVLMFFREETGKMHGYVANPKSEKAVSRMTTFGRVMYVEMALLTLLGIWCTVRLWPFMVSSGSTSGTLDYILAITALLGLVYVMMWTMWGVLFRPFTASIVFWRLEDTDVLRLDRTVRRYCFYDSTSGPVKPHSSMQFDFQAAMNEAAAEYAKGHRLITRRQKHE